jgi:transposase
MPNRKNVAFSAFLYHHRNLVERFFNKLKHTASSLPATTSDPAISSQASKLAAIRLWLRFNESIA